VPNNLGFSSDFLVQGNPGFSSGLLPPINHGLPPGLFISWNLRFFTRPSFASQFRIFIRLSYTFMSKIALGKWSHKYFFEKTSKLLFSLIYTS